MYATVGGARRVVLVKPTSTKPVDDPTPFAQADIDKAVSTALAAQPPADCSVQDATIAKQAATLNENETAIAKLTAERDAATTSRDATYANIDALKG
jgi:hypothetical protein